VRNTISTGVSSFQATWRNRRSAARMIALVVVSSAVGRTSTAARSSGSRRGGWLVPMRGCNGRPCQRTTDLGHSVRDDRRRGAPRASGDLGAAIATSPPSCAASAALTSTLATVVRARRLVGGDREEAEVAESVSSVPLTTVTGPGGVGKTALALVVAAESTPRLPDGVFVVWLASLRSATSPTLLRPPPALTPGAPTGARPWACPGR